MEHSDTHKTRQAADVKISTKKVNSAPVIKAPKILVAAKVTPRSTKDVIMVPKMPNSNAFKLLQRQQLSLERNADLKSKMARYTTAMPKVVHKNAGVNVMMALNRKIAVTMPAIKAAKMPKPVQSLLQLQEKLNIKSPPAILYAKGYTFVHTEPSV